MQFLLFVSFHPWPQSLLYYWYPYYVAAVVYDSLELVSFVKHLVLIPFSVAIVFLNQLDLSLCSHHMYVVHLVFEHLFSKGLFLSYLRQILQFLQVLNHITMADVFSRKHAKDILEEVVLEIVIGGHLQIRDEFAHVLRVSFENCRYHLCFILKVGE